MAQAVGLLLVVLFIAGTAGFAAHVYQQLKAEDILPLPKIPKLTRAPGSKRPPVKARTQRARKQAVRTGRTASVIFAEAITASWAARKAHQRGQNPERPLPRRLVFRSGTPPPRTDGEKARAAPPSPSGNGSTPQSPHDAPSATGGTQMSTPTNGRGSASDLASAVHRIIAEAEAGGLQSKVRGALVMGEGLKQLGAAMEQHAKHLQETRLYPPHVWEPWRQGAQLAHGAATKATEAGNAAAEIARRPMGEANGQAPHHDELNKK